MGRWKELVGSLGEALLALWRAELEALWRDLGASGRRFLAALGWLALAAAVAFWAVGVLTYALVQVVSLWLSSWAAALVVLAGLIVLVVVVGSYGLSSIREIEAPSLTLDRRLADHREWWRTRILQEDSPIDEEEAEP